MIFKPVLLEKIFAGEKTVTRRPVKYFKQNGKAKDCPYRVDQVYALQPGMGRDSVGSFRVTAVDRRPLVAITDEDALREGFADFEEFAEYWMALYGGNWDPDQLVDRIEFELVEQTHAICKCCSGNGVEAV